jgi:hypothetical protein
VENIEYPDKSIERIDDKAQVDVVHRRVRTSQQPQEYLNGVYNDAEIQVAGNENRIAPFILRLDDVPATPRSLERIRDRVRILNLRLETSSTPFRLWVSNDEGSR